MRRKYAQEWKGKMEFTIATNSDIEQLVQMRMFYIFEHFKGATDTQIVKIQQQLPNYFEKHIGNDIIAFIAKEQDKVVATEDGYPLYKNLGFADEKIPCASMKYVI